MWRVQAAASFICVVVSGCAPTVDRIRTLERPVTYQSTKQFDEVAGCIGSTAVAQMNMKTVPTSYGTSYVYSHGASLGGTAGMLVDIRRGPPVSVDIFITGGPWLGQDNKIRRVVGECV